MAKDPRSHIRKPLDVVASVSGQTGAAPIAGCLEATTIRAEIVRCFEVSMLRPQLLGEPLDQHLALLWKADDIIDAEVGEVEDSLEGAIVAEDNDGRKPHVLVAAPNGFDDRAKQVIADVLVHQHKTDKGLRRRDIAALGGLDNREADLGRNGKERSGLELVPTDQDGFAGRQHRDLSRDLAPRAGFREPIVEMRVANRS